MARVFKFALVLAYLTFLIINVAVVILMIETLLSKLANADDGTYVKFGSEITKQQTPARYFGVGYQGRTEVFFDYQLESGLVSNNDASAKIKSGYFSASLGLSTAGKGLYAKGFVGVSLDTTDLPTPHLAKDFELGIKGEDSISVGLFIRRNSELKLFQLPSPTDFIGAKLQIPL